MFADTLFTMDTRPAVHLRRRRLDDDGRGPEPLRRRRQGGDQITDFIEKPDTPISNEAIVGIYYVRDGAALGKEIQYLSITT